MFYVTLYTYVFDLTVYAALHVSINHLNTGQASQDKLAQNISDSDGVFIAFFSKYTQYTFVYALGWGGPVFIQYSNGNWGPIRLIDCLLMKLDMFSMLLMNTNTMIAAGSKNMAMTLVLI